MPAVILQPARLSELSRGYAQSSLTLSGQRRSVCCGHRGRLLLSGNTDPFVFPMPWARAGQRSFRRGVPRATSGVCFPWSAAWSESVCLRDPERV